MLATLLIETIIAAVRKSGIFLSEFQRALITSYVVRMVSSSPDLTKSSSESPLTISFLNSSENFSLVIDSIPLIKEDSWFS